MLTTVKLRNGVKGTKPPIIQTLQPNCAPVQKVLDGAIVLLSRGLVAVDGNLTDLRALRECGAVHDDGGGGGGGGGSDN